MNGGSMRVVRLPVRFDLRRVQLRGSDQRRRIAGVRVLQPRNHELPVPSSARDDHDTRLRGETIEVRTPPLALADDRERPCSKAEKNQRGGCEPAPIRRRRFFAQPYGQARLERLASTRERRCIALEIFQFQTEQQVDRLDSPAECHAQVRRRRAADNARNYCVGPLFDRDRQIADAETVESFATGHVERIVDEVANGREHRRYLVGILLLPRAGGDVLKHEPGFGVDEEHLLDTVLQRVEHYDLGKWLAGTPRREPPSQRAPGHAQLHRAAERLHHRREHVLDGTPDGRAHHREQRVGKRVRVALNRRGDGCLDAGGKGRRQLWIVSADGERFGEYAAYLARPQGPVVDVGFERAKVAAFGTDEQRPEFIERLVVRRAGRDGRCRGSNALAGNLVPAKGRFSHSRRPRRRGSGTRR